MIKFPPIFGIPVSPLPMEEVLDEIDAWITSGDHKFICTADVHALTLAAEDQSIRQIYRSAAIVTPDGMPLVWYLRWLGFTGAERVCGPDLMPALFRRSQERGYRYYLYGASEKTLALMMARLEREFPEAQIVGAFAPPYRELTDKESNEVEAVLNAAKPDIVLVGLGAPKQDRWMAAHRARLDAPALIGVGAAFDMFAGTVRRAPRLFQRTGLEWLFRIAQEPRRLARRYFTSNWHFATLIIAERFGRASYPDA